MTVLVTVLTAFASGAMAAAMGAMPSVILCGLAVCIGSVGLASGSAFNFVNDFALGMFLGPHVAFGPACVAALYAQHRGYISESKNIFLPLIGLNKPDVLAVSGLFAVLGYYINALCVRLAGGRVDTVAVAIVILSMAGRVLFGGIGLRGIVGRVPEGKKRFCVTCCDCWLGHQSCASGHQLFLLGAVIGCFSGYMVKLILDLAASTGNAALSAIAPLPVWGFAIVGCVFIACGKTMPVWHHIALIAGYAVNMAYLGGGSDESCILWGVAFGVVAAYAGDLLAKLFSVYGEGYVDPPSMAVSAVLADVWRRKLKAVNP